MRKKSVEKGETKSRRVMLNLTESQHQDLIAQAERYDFSLQDYIRRLLFDELSPLIEMVEMEKKKLEAELQLAKVRLECAEEELNLERSRNPIEPDERRRIQQMNLERSKEFLANLKVWVRLMEEMVEVQKLRKHYLTNQLEKKLAKEDYVARLVSSLKQ